MERLSCTLAQAPFLYGWHSLFVWAKHLPQGSAVWRAKHPDEAKFASEFGRAVIAADTFDAIMTAMGAIVESNGGALTRKPKPYPRPGAKDESRHFGSGDIPVSQFDDWYYATD